MLKKIISGHQTGADIAAIDAAIANGFPCGGWVPKGRKTEIGPLPEKYVVQEMTTGGYPKRTERNVVDADGTVIFTHGRLTGGSDLTRKYAIQHSKPSLHVDLAMHDAKTAVALVCKFISEYRTNVLNVAGPRASSDAKIYEAVYQVMKAVISVHYSQ